MLEEWGGGEEGMEKEREREREREKEEQTRIERGAILMNKVQKPLQMRTYCTICVTTGRKE